MLAVIVSEAQQPSRPSKYLSAVQQLCCAKLDEATSTALAQECRQQAENLLANATTRTALDQNKSNMVFLIGHSTFSYL